MKVSESERRQKEQEVEKLKEELNRKKRLDAIHIREEIARTEREEKELEQQIIKEKSKLDQVKSFRFKFLFNCFYSFSYIHDVKIIIYVY